MQSWILWPILKLYRETLFLARQNFHWIGHRQCAQLDPFISFDWQTLWILDHFSFAYLAMLLQKTILWTESSFLFLVLVLNALLKYCYCNYFYLVRDLITNLDQLVFDCVILSERSSSAPNWIQTKFIWLLIQSQTIKTYSYLFQVNLLRMHFWWYLGKPV